MAAVVGVVVLAAPGATAEPELTDQAISDTVEDELAFDPGVPSFRIVVGTSESIVTLTGTVSNLLAKERATRVAETVKGVRSVVDDVGRARSIAIG